MSTFDDHARAGMKAIGEQRYDDAVAAFGEAVAMEPDRPDMNNALGVAHLHRGDAGSAIPFLERAVELAKEFTADEIQEMKRDYHMQLAAAYQVTDAIAQAEDALRAAATQWPTAPEPWVRLAQLLATSCRLEGAKKAWHHAADLSEGEQKEALQAVVGSVEAFEDTDHDATIFLRGHAESYIEYFDEVAKKQIAEGWYAEAARMAKKGVDGALVPIVADGARPWALSRVDLVNPNDGTVSEVYNEREPMVIALNGLEPLAQVPVLFPLEGYSFEAWVCSRCPWHWLDLTVEFETAESDTSKLVDTLDERIGAWYLDGWNGKWGTQSTGRFHYATDPTVINETAVHYIFDLGRAKYDCIQALMNRLVVLHDTQPIRRVILGAGRLPPR